MAARCELTGKGKQFGNNVSFSLRRTKRVFKPNLQKKTFIVDGQGHHGSLDQGDPYPQEKRLAHQHQDKGQGCGIVAQSKRQL